MPDPELVSQLFSDEVAPTEEGADRLTRFALSPQMAIHSEGGEF